MIGIGVELDGLGHELHYLDDRSNAPISSSAARTAGYAERAGALPYGARGYCAITAIALVASVGDARGFKIGREFAAWLGLTPRQYSSGGITRLGRIT
jgi:transposase